MFFHCLHEEQGVSLHKTYLTLLIVTSEKSQGYGGHFVHQGTLFICSKPQILLKACAHRLDVLSDHEQQDMSFKQHKSNSMLL